ncbi:hypothetical protein [Haladaptatus sp.]|uniref:hypothetical protein n=1 Tax=Haladaptatus sp. TaxID=1973141 RepID=UPI003C34A5CF
MSIVDILIGSGPGQRIVILGTIVLYVYLSVRRPDAARESFESGARMLVGLATLVLAALLLASAIETLVPASAISRLVGGSAGTPGVVLAGLLGGVLPGGPYAVYPIISGVADNGALVAVGGLLFPTSRTVLFALVGTGLFGAVLIYFLTPEQFVSAAVGERRTPPMRQSATNWSDPSVSPKRTSISRPVTRPVRMRVSVSSFHITENTSCPRRTRRTHCSS